MSALTDSEIIVKLADGYRSGAVSGHKLSEMMSAGEITKSERRKIVRLGSAPKKELSPRQLLRVAVKEKKSLPKLTKEDRRQKYLLDKIEEERVQNSAKYSRTVCLGCRQEGHVLQYCPNAKPYAATTNYDRGQISGSYPAVTAVVPSTPNYLNDDLAPGRKKKKISICFNCGSTEHALSACPTPRRGTSLPFATCFICNQGGHLAKDCEQNTNGMYPHGGCCHHCQSIQHLAKDCPQNPLKKSEAEETVAAQTPNSRVTPAGSEDILGNVEVVSDKSSRKKSKRSSEDDDENDEVDTKAKKHKKHKK